MSFAWQFQTAPVWIYHHPAGHGFSQLGRPGPKCADLDVSDKLMSPQFDMALISEKMGWFTSDLGCHLNPFLNYCNIDVSLPWRQVPVEVPLSCKLGDELERLAEESLCCGSQLGGVWQEKWSITAHKCSARLNIKFNPVYSLFPSIQPLWPCRNALIPWESRTFSTDDTTTLSVDLVLNVKGQKMGLTFLKKHLSP